MKKRIRSQKKGSGFKKKPERFKKLSLEQTREIQKLIAENEVHYKRIQRIPFVEEVHASPRGMVLNIISIIVTLIGIFVTLYTLF
jgi:hypothetical protein